MFMKSLIAASLAIISATSAYADAPGKHPYYLHALTDLRTARWLVTHQPGDRKVYAGEDVAFDEINAAIGELKKASIDDGKDINDHPGIDVKEHGSRLLRAIETLKQAQADISKEEDNPESRGLKHRAAEHIDHAIKATVKAHSAWVKEEQHKK